MQNGMGPPRSLVPAVGSKPAASRPMIYYMSAGDQRSFAGQAREEVGRWGWWGQIRRCDREFAEV